MELLILGVLALLFYLTPTIIANNRLRWSWFPGQFGGKAKMDSGFDYAASFSAFSCIA